MMDTTSRSPFVYTLYTRLSMLHHATAVIGTDPIYSLRHYDLSNITMVIF